MDDTSEQLSDALRSDCHRIALSRLLRCFIPDAGREGAERSADIATQRTERALLACCRASMTIIARCGAEQQASQSLLIAAIRLHTAQQQEQS